MFLRWEKTHNLSSKKQYDFGLLYGFQIISLVNRLQKKWRRFSTRRRTLSDIVDSFLSERKYFQGSDTFAGVGASQVYHKVAGSESIWLLLGNARMTACNA